MNHTANPGTDKSDRLLNEIGFLVREDVPSTEGVILLYAEVAGNVVGASLFVAHRDQIVGTFASGDLEDALLDLWNEGRAERPWVAVEYLLDGKRFRAKFIYPDDPHWRGEFETREPVARRYFGDKPIVYPPMPQGLPGLTFKL